MLVHQSGCGRQGIFHGPGDGSSVANGPLEAAGGRILPDGAKRRESFAPFLKKATMDFRILRFAVGIVFAALSFFSCRCRNERGR